MQRRWAPLLRLGRPAVAASSRETRIAPGPARDRHHPALRSQRSLERIGSLTSPSGHPGARGGYVPLERRAMEDLTAVQAEASCEPTRRVRHSLSRSRRGQTLLIESPGIGDRDLPAKSLRHLGFEDTARLGRDRMEPIADHRRRGRRAPSRTATGEAPRDERACRLELARKPDRPHRAAHVAFEDSPDDVDVLVT